MTAYMSNDAHFFAVLGLAPKASATGVVSKMHQRLRRREREALATHRAQSDYTYDIYQDGVDEEEYFRKGDPVVADVRRRSSCILHTLAQFA
ncbi:hypothetical protein PTMSG1_02637 [Pyrenophora teres f. maculata]|nr:hypothetical protein PTMSG1_02637 [Pyrenophora teres f. maculata]